MEIRLIKKTGVPAHEIDAHQKIHKALSGAAFSSRWRGYASFKLLRASYGSGDDDFDLVLVTHTNIVVLELKNWSGRVLESRGGHWYMDGNDRGESPVELANLKAKKLASVMQKKLGKEKVPFVQAFVVLQQDVTFKASDEAEVKSVLKLDDVLAWSNKRVFEAIFPAWRKPKQDPIALLGDYDLFFLGSSVKPRDYLVEGFRPESTPLWEHPNKLYAEYRGKAKDDPEAQGLIRQWDFSALGMELIGEDERGFIGLREQRVYEFVANSNPELSMSLLRPIRRHRECDVTRDFAEVYALPPKITRLTEFTHSVLPKLHPDERVVLAKAMLRRFADLHDLNVAHRDIGEHSLWIERPAKVVMSGFPAAYYPSMQTLGSYREKVKVERAKLPEDLAEAFGATPYHRDVYMLGALCHVILFGERPPKVSNVYAFVPRQQDPYEGVFNAILTKALDSEPTNRYGNARALLEAFNTASSKDSQALIDGKAFDAFRARTKQRDYDETEVLVDDDDQLAFRSESQSGQQLLVKVWHGVEPDPSRPDYSIRLLSFLERARAMSGSGLPGLPAVRDFGLSRRSLILVVDWIEGITLTAWLAAKPKLESRLSVSLRLTEALLRLHTLELPHGDIHPNNIIITADGVPTFIDALDFRRSSHDAYTTAYLPPDYKTLPPEARDRYSLAAVLNEVFEGGPAGGSGPYPIPHVYEQLHKLLTERNASSLDPLQSVLAKTGQDEMLAQERPTFVVTLRELPAPESVLPSDNGHYHVSVKPSRKSPGAWMFYIAGVGLQLTLECHPDSQSINVWCKPLTQSELMQTQNRSDHRLIADIQLRTGFPEAGELASFLLERYVPADETSVAQVVAAEGGDNGEAETTVTSSSHTARPIMSVRNLWQQLLQAEEEALPSIVVADEPRPNPNKRGQTLLPYHSDSVIDPDPTDTLTLERQGHDGIWRNCGEIDLKLSTFGELAELSIDGWSARGRVDIGDKFRLRSTMEKASFNRRNIAVQRILDDKAVIPHLANYFTDPSADNGLAPYSCSPPSDGDLEPYTNGEKPLNDSQLEAFKKALSYGPISLLQGPPGTGKTWFIATLLHYLMTKENARRILLVSQAHEAVNNALEKSQELCRNKGITFDAVRLGAESAVSDAIRHLHADAIEQSYRERFKAEYKERIVGLGREIGLPPAYCECMVDIWTRLGRLAEHLVKLGQQQHGEGEEEAQAHRARLKSLWNTFSTISEDVYSLPVMEEDAPADIVRYLETQLLEQHDIQSSQAVERFKKLLRLSDDWMDALGTPGANFTEFLAKSRTIVAGTLVGIGQRVSGVVQNLFDWVIIDEAGRAAPSELAVAMQAGRRILLVGDHKQLPPTFDEDVKDAVKKQYPSQPESVLLASDFERLFDSRYGQIVGTSLRHQYRMAPDIGELVSDCFYGKQLTTGRGVPPAFYSELPKCLSQQISWIDTAPLGKDGYEKRSPDRKDSWNEAEANIVMNILRQIIESELFVHHVKSKLQPGEPAIGIICMYSKQRTLLERKKREASWLADSRKLVKIDTVDSYQGKENQIVILTTVRNNEELNPGFLISPNRVNVAMSRAMNRLIIVASSRMWQGRNASLPLGQVWAKVEEFTKVGRASVLSGKEFY
ncbi:AAA domain-containing protein [Laribacter hongkongensis]|uniref:AAA domain-containing protein n=1 Tax=Laribacter hongkongensis TaxID=168471 RepID=UPI001EFDAAA7|nr:AAA domain-containing protein [Laribacter hongkongensis]MCG9124865.1 AAA domain-containing protein [Laribacter hongkongensis]